MNRLPYLLLGLASLVIGVLAGLARLGWEVPVPSSAAIPLHGSLLVCGFFGTVIGLERAVALGRPWLYAGPLLAGVSGVMAIVGVQEPLPALAAVASAGIALAAAGLIVREQPAAHSATLLFAAACWLIGNLLWLARVGFSTVSLWWIAFLVLTIAGERLELTRLLPPSPALRRVFVTVVATLLVAAALAVLQPWAVQWFGIALAALGGWLVVADIARRNVREGGLTGFVARTLLGGYAWLVVGGLALATGNNAPGSAPWDIALHATFLGFVFSMVFAHAPMILPAVAKVRIRFGAVFYVHVLVLHASLALRVAGDLLAEHDWRMVGALGNAVAILIFVGNTLAGVLAARQGPGNPSDR